MPAFTFEKISPPATLGHSQPNQMSANQAASHPQTQLSSIVQVLGRFVEARMSRAERIENSTLRRRDVPPPK